MNMISCYPSTQFSPLPIFYVEQPNEAEKTSGVRYIE